MTPAEHLAQAEVWLAQAPPPDTRDINIIDIAMSVTALAHAVVALAAELGVPHGGPGGGDGSAQAHPAAG